MTVDDFIQKCEQFETNDQVETVVRNWFDIRPALFYENEIKKKLQKRVIKEGDYVEKFRCFL